MNIYFLVLDPSSCSNVFRSNINLKLLMERQGHSVLGIISFCVSSIAIVLFFGVWISVATELDSTITGSIAILQVFFNLIGLGTGIPALFSQSKQRIFPILGVVFSSCSFIIALSVMLLGSFVS